VNWGTGSWVRKSFRDIATDRRPNWFSFSIVLSTATLRGLFCEELGDWELGEKKFSLHRFRPKTKLVFFLCIVDNDAAMTFCEELGDW